MTNTSEQLDRPVMRRYTTFAEFSEHFYGASEGEGRKSEDPNASFGLNLSREIVRQRPKDRVPTS